jgi:diguanylate cyclase (GGDEF)-like protein/PAS domain S-box-containing protein
MVSASSIAKLNRVKHRIILFSLLAILLTGTLVGVSTTLPMYHSVKTQIANANITSAIAQANALENQVARFRSLAHQFTSRTEIRKRLERYVQGEWTLQQVQEYSHPRLNEPARKIPDLAAMIRLGPKNEIIAAVGELSEQVKNIDFSSEPIKVMQLDTKDNTVLVRVTAPIRDADGQAIGLDILYFYTQVLTPLMRDFGTFGRDADLFIVNRASQQGLVFDRDFDKPELINLSQDQQLKLSRMDSDKPKVYKFDFDPNFSLIYAPFSFEDWGLIIKIPNHAFYRSAYHDLQWAIFSIIAMLILGALLTHYAINPLIRRLIGQAHEIESNALELRLAASVFEHTQEAIVISDPNMTIVRANKGFARTLGLTHNAVAGKNLQDFIATECLEERINETFRQSIGRKDSWQGEVWYRCQNQGTDRIIPTLQSVSAVKNDDGDVVYFIHIFNDISDQKTAENKMKHLAHSDSLTNLPNRNALMTHLQNAIDHSDVNTHFSLMFIDLDKFKPVNDQHGHQVGDEILKQVAQRIRESVRADDVVGRLGGDEFLMIIESIQDMQHAGQIANKIIDRLSEPFNVDGLEIEIGASIGIAHHPKDGATVDGLIKAADQAMYRAKQSGRNRFC